MERFYIFNCFDQVVGNPDGYRTIRGATREQNRAGSKAYNAIWQAYDQAKQANPKHSFVSKVAAKDVNGYPTI